MRLDALPDDQARRLRAYPPSAKLVYFMLVTEGTMTQEQLVTETMMPRRTVRNALDQLIEAGIVTARPCPYDARKRVYQIPSSG